LCVLQHTPYCRNPPEHGAYPPTERYTPDEGNAKFDPGGPGDEKKRELNPVHDRVVDEIDAERVGVETVHYGLAATREVPKGAEQTERCAGAARRPGDGE